MSTHLSAVRCSCSPLLLTQLAIPRRADPPCFPSSSSSQSSFLPFSLPLLLHLKLAHQTPRSGGRKRLIEDLARARPFPCVMNAQFNSIDNEGREKRRRKMYPSHHRHRHNATRRDRQSRFFVFTFPTMNIPLPPPSVPPPSVRPPSLSPEILCTSPRSRPAPSAPVIESWGQRLSAE